MLPPTIRSASDLVTSHDAIREGFLKQALAKTQKAYPFIQEAHELDAALQAVDDVHTLSTITVPTIQAALLAAAGFSNKAIGHLSSAELQSALAQVLDDIVASNPTLWRSEIVFRFLLTKGDTLGGRMRNFTGALGGRQLSRVIINTLNNRSPIVTFSPTNPDKVVSITWDDRQLVFDRKPRFLDKNIDAILLDTSLSVRQGTARMEQPDAYLACGELKGGIDPAGADEHWKTARSAFERIRKYFHDNPPPFFFVGAAIEPAMAQEIYDWLQDGRLTYAANLTVPHQVQDLVYWLISL